MGATSEDTTARQILGAYEAAQALGADALSAEARRLKEEFERRTGAFRPEDPWFEARSRLFWDDALTTPSFAELAKGRSADHGPTLDAFGRAHRGLFVVAATSSGSGFGLVDRWSGAEFLVSHLDEAQLVALEHAEDCLVDARVVAADESGTIFLLPGAFHHAPDATEPALRVVEAARERGMKTRAALDALLRMELVFRSSSRVKATFAYRVESLARA